MPLIKFLKRQFIFVLVIILGFISLISAYSQYQDLAQRNQELKNKIKQLAAENKKLLNIQNKLQNDPVFAESVAREKLKVAKEGEVIYKVISPE